MREGDEKDRTGALPARSSAFRSAENAQAVCWAALNLKDERKMVAVTVADLVARTGLKPARIEGGILKAMELRWLAVLDREWVLTVGGIEAVRSRLAARHDQP